MYTFEYNLNSSDISKHIKIKRLNVKKNQDSKTHDLK